LVAKENLNSLETIVQAELQAKELGFIQASKVAVPETFGYESFVALAMYVPLTPLPLTTREESTSDKDPSAEEFAEFKVANEIAAAVTVASKPKPSLRNQPVALRTSFSSLINPSFLGMPRHTI
jgi:hypothetical protein